MRLLPQASVEHAEECLDKEWACWMLPPAPLLVSLPLCRARGSVEHPEKCVDEWPC